MYFHTYLLGAGCIGGFMVVHLAWPPDQVSKTIIYHTEAGSIFSDYTWNIKYNSFKIPLWFKVTFSLNSPYTPSTWKNLSALFYLLLLHQVSTLSYVLLLIINWYLNSFAGLALKCQQCSTKDNIFKCDSDKDNGEIVECDATEKFCETISYSK